MSIYACGCSFTYGEELKIPTESAWPILLGKKLNQPVSNFAVSGGTNFRTVYQTIKNLNKYDFYLIAWTSYSRFTFYKSNNNFEVNFNPQLKNSLYSNEVFFKDWGKILYAHWYNELYAFKIWLQQIIQLQSVLKQDYLMINTLDNHLKYWCVNEDNFIDSVKHLINFDLMNDEQIFDEYKEIQYYLKLIDTSKFYKWNEFNITDLCQQFECGPEGHILEEGHNHLAESIYQHVQNKTSNS